MPVEPGADSCGGSAQHTACADISAGVLTDSTIVSDILENSNVLPRITMEITANPTTLVVGSVAQLQLVASVAAELATVLEIGVQKVDVSAVRAVTTGRRQVQDDTDNTDVDKNSFLFRRELVEADVTVAFDVVMTTLDPAATFTQLQNQLADSNSKLRKGATLSSVDPASLSYGFTCPIGFHRPEVQSTHHLEASPFSSLAAHSSVKAHTHSRLCRERQTVSSVQGVVSLTRTTQLAAHARTAVHARRPTRALAPNASVTRVRTPRLPYRHGSIVCDTLGHARLLRRLLWNLWDSHRHGIPDRVLRDQPALATRRDSTDRAVPPLHRPALRRLLRAREHGGQAGLRREHQEPDPGRALPGDHGAARAPAHPSRTHIARRLTSPALNASPTLCRESFHAPEATRRASKNLRIKFLSTSRLRRAA